MSVFKPILPKDVSTARSSLTQIIDVVQADISSSLTSRKYQVFVTGGIGPGVTSSLFQTIYDQDYTLQTSNPIMDMTFGLYFSGTVVTGTQLGMDSNGKLLFPSNSMMMREKVNIYKQFAQTLLGNASGRFYSPFGSSDATNAIDNALFMNVKRLFGRDSIKRETVAMRIASTASVIAGIGPTAGGTVAGDNLHLTSTGSFMTITDIGAASNVQQNVYGSGVGRLVDSSNTANSVGLIFYQEHIAVLDIDKVISGTQACSGTISAMAGASTINGAPIPAGKTVMGARPGQHGGTFAGGNPFAKFVPDFLVSGSVDDIVDHFRMCRFGSGSNLTMATWQNLTNINSTLIFCRANADEFNYSSNPTYVDANNNIVVVDPNNVVISPPFSMPTTIGLYDGNDNILAIAKFSRPIEKNNQKDLTWRVRLDF